MTVTPGSKGGATEAGVGQAGLREAPQWREGGPPQTSQGPVQGPNRLDVGAEGLWQWGIHSRDCLPRWAAPCPTARRWVQRVGDDDESSEASEVTMRRRNDFGPVGNWRDEIFIYSASWRRFYIHCKTECAFIFPQHISAVLQLLT